MSSSACVVVVVARRRKGCAIIARGEKNNNIFVSSLSFYLSIVVIVSSSSSKKKKKTTISKVWGKIRTHFSLSIGKYSLQNTMSIIRRHHCPHTTKDRCRRVLLGREGGGSSGGGHFGGMVVSSQAAAPSFCDRVHFRPVLRVGFTKTSLGVCVYFWCCISCVYACDSARRSHKTLCLFFSFFDAIACTVDPS